jgi:hypothetical protein
VIDEPPLLVPAALPATVERELVLELELELVFDFDELHPAASRSRAAAAVPRTFLPPRFMSRCPPEDQTIYRY